jgi:sarcosine oxidase
MTTPGTVRRQVEQNDIDHVTRLLLAYLPAAAGVHRRSATCLYTNTPDGHFLVMPHVQHEEVLIVSACSGHGFKFASAIGEAVADLLMNVARPDLLPFGRQRLVAQKA